MSQVQDLIGALSGAGKNPKETVLDEMKRTGKKAVGCFPIYVPEEIIHAAGLLPVGLWGGNTEFKEADKYFQSFCCSIMRANVEQGIRGTYDMLSAVVITSYCDTLRAVLVNWPVAVPNMKTIPMILPQNRIEPAAVEFMLEKFEIFRGEMESISGIKATESMLEESFGLYERYRAAMRDFTELAGTHPKTVNAVDRHYVIKAGYFMDKEAYTEKIEQINTCLKGMPDEKAGAKVVLTGLLAEPENFLELLAENGIGVAADDLAQESRQFRTKSRPDGSVFERIAYRYMDLRGCTFFYEEMKARGQMLIDMVKQSGADGILVCMYKFCDPEEFDYPVYKKEVEAAQIPMLYLEIEQQMDSVEQLRTRIQSFKEMIM
ncbi:MAG: 2-hydroxyacyl-CoA dehydratase family protein [Clostridiales bacterium]|nr:2-hydroxyacyl-CoA dehydratase family protein [Clostridiales bacterium]